MAAHAVADVIELEPELEEIEAEPTNYALRLTEALDAIAAAQPGDEPTAVVAAQAAPAAPAQAPTVPASFAAALEAAQQQQPALKADDLAVERASKQSNRVAAILEALNKLPPIKLPIGPAIPWRIGLPMLVALCFVMLFVSRPGGSATAPADQPGVTLPSHETYAVQQQAPLFAKPEATPQSQPLGVKEPEAANVDVFDLGIKFIAVLAIACGSLYLLKRFGPGGSSIARGDSNSAVRVVSSVVLAPNRTVHVLRTPDGKSLLLGATPNQVNLIADLGELSDDVLTAQGASFLDVLATKLARAA